MKKQIQWINVAKFMAIFAVLVDHTNGVLYTNPYIAYGSYFSVTLFIFLSGITLYRSNERNKNARISSLIWKRTKRIFLPYALTVFVYMIVMNTGKFVFTDYITYLLHFNISGPHYFVLLYIQLLFIAPLLSYLLDWANKKRKRGIFFFVFLIAIILLSIWTTNCTDILGIYGGGGKLFGGSYLIVFYLGMLCSMKMPNINAWKQWKIGGVFAILLSATVVWYLFICRNQFKLDHYFPLGTGFNPPSISLIIYAFLMAGTCMTAVSFFEHLNIKIVDNIIKSLGYFGVHTLFIFLYHKLFLDYFLFPYCNNLHPIIKVPLFYFTMIAGPIGIEKIYKWIKNQYLRIKD